MNLPPPLRAVSMFFLLILSSGNCQRSAPKVDFTNEFESILSEENLQNWEGDPEYWKFEDGILTGEITPDKILAEHSYFIWKGGSVEDFELKVEYRITQKGNSGINYRSQKIENRNHLLRGYQADIDGANEFSGQLYEEKGRSFLARPNQVAHINTDNTINQIGVIAFEKELSAAINSGDWNEYHIIAKGRTFIHTINGQVMSIAIDDGKSFKEKGLLGFQLHLGPPMKVEFRNLQLKRFTD